MEVGKLYFLKDEYLEKFNLTLNKGPGHDRPFLCCHEDKFCPDIKWMVPLSSKLDRYEEIYRGQIEHTGKCNSIDFTYLFNRKSVVRINAAFPVTDQYVKNIYVNPDTGKDLQIKNKDQNRIEHKLKKLIVIQGQGHNIFYNDVFDMQKRLVNELAQLANSVDEMNEHVIQPDMPVSV